MRSAFDPARAFVHSSVGDMGSFVRWTVSESPILVPRKGEADHAVILTTQSGCVEGCVQYFGNLVFSVRLACSYVGPEIGCDYIVDPYREANPAEQRLSVTDLAENRIDIPQFSHQSTTNTSRVQAAHSAALNRILSHYVRRQNEDVVQKATDDARRSDPQLANLPREQVEQYVRRKINERLG